MQKKFSPAEIIIVVLALAFIFISEYYYIILKDHDRAIFLGLWPPTIMLFLIYMNVKKLL